MLTAGFSWPVEAIPPVIRAASMVLPSKPGVDAFLKVTQMGAGLGDICPSILHMWCLTLFYSLCSIFLLGRIIDRQRRGEEI